MKKKETISFGVLLQKFFVDFLAVQKSVSSETIASYRDTFRLLLLFMQEKRLIAPAAVQVKDLDVPVILSFLDYLEQERKNSVRSRNQRLAAIRSFFRLVALSDPESVNQASRILAIPVKRTERLLVKSLTPDEMEAIVMAPDRSTWTGRRDHAMLLTLYNTGARVSEIIALQKTNFMFGSSTFVHIHGKGRKERSLPLWSRTAQALRAWFDEPRSARSPTAFPNTVGRQLTRNGFDHILQHTVEKASKACSSLSDKHVTPHMVRHSTATHLLQSGVDMSVIALWLGHERLETTHIYVEADLSAKQRALDKLSPGETPAEPKLEVSDEVLAFLASL
ncbi:tyrosine-type recombinase/integrase [Candidatus Obscuribacterales bacterium]|nr:tyrosine-type recombinase/integrase [Candidatus Obscuribacterales bacterium]